MLSIHLSGRWLGQLIESALPRPSKWHLTDSSGGEVQVGTPVARLSVGGTADTFYLREGNDSRVYSLHYYAGGAAVGLSASPLPVSADFSPRGMPGAELGSIYLMPRVGAELRFEEFKGPGGIISLGGSFSYFGAGVSMILFGMSRSAFDLMQVVAPELASVVMLLSTKAVAFIWGSNVGVPTISGSVIIYMGLFE